MIIYQSVLKKGVTLQVEFSSTEQNINLSYRQYVFLISSAGVRLWLSMLPTNRTNYEGLTSKEILELLKKFGNEII